jgi:hypothetical protein
VTAGSIEEALGRIIQKLVQEGAPKHEAEFAAASAIHVLMAMVAESDDMKRTIASILAQGTVPSHAMVSLLDTKRGGGIIVFASASNEAHLEDGIRHLVSHLTETINRNDPARN